VVWQNKLKSKGEKRRRIALPVMIFTIAVILLEKLEAAQAQWIKQHAREYYMME